jgi:hypothetical protein
MKKTREINSVRVQAWVEKLMEQCTLKNVNNGLNTNIYSYLETSGVQSSNMYLNDVQFFSTSLNLISVAA